MAVDKNGFESARVKKLDSVTTLTVTPNNNISINNSSCLQFGNLYKICINFTPSANISSFADLFTISGVPTSSDRYAATILFNRTDNTPSGMIYWSNGMNYLQCTGGVTKDKVYAFELII